MREVPHASTPAEQEPTEQLYSTIEKTTDLPVESPTEVFELEVLPGIKAAVEFGKTPEADIDGRREMLGNTKRADLPTDLRPMTPISEALQNYRIPRPQDVATPLHVDMAASPTSDGVAMRASHNPRIKQGFVAGVVIALIVVLLISR
jgi:hypothetical protein